MPYSHSGLSSFTSSSSAGCEYSLKCIGFFLQLQILVYSQYYFKVVDLDVIFDKNCENYNGQNCFSSRVEKIKSNCKMLLFGLRPSFLLKIEYRENEYL